MIDIFGFWVHAWSNGGHWVLFVVHVCACCYPVLITGGWWVDFCKPVIWNWSLPPLSIHVHGICLSWMTCMGRIELQQGYQWTYVYNSNSENVRKSVCCIELNVPLTLTFIYQVMWVCFASYGHVGYWLVSVCWDWQGVATQLLLMELILSIIRSVMIDHICLNTKNILHVCLFGVLLQ